MKRELRGTAASGGIGVGKAVVLAEHLPDNSRVKGGTAAEEATRLAAAAAALTEELQAQAVQLRQLGAEETAIAEAHITLLHALQQPMAETIAAGVRAETAVNTVCRRFAGQLAPANAADVKDLCDGLLRQLCGGVPSASFPANAVPVVGTLLPSAVCRFPKGTVAAVVAETGAVSCHSAVLLRAKGIPAVLSVPQATALIHTGDTLLVDGTEGSVTVVTQ